MTTEPTPHDPIPAEPETRHPLIRALLSVLPKDQHDGALAALRVLQREARASLAAENAELREAGDRMVRECMAVVRTLDRQHAHVRAARSDLQTAVGWFAGALASPSPSADYAARLRREGAEAALAENLSVDHLEAVLDNHDNGLIDRAGLWTQGKRTARQMAEWLSKELNRAAILAQTEGESDAPKG